MRPFKGPQCLCHRKINNGYGKIRNTGTSIKKSKIGKDGIRR
jgi:hypothetical protein